jgi:hypothetical protein
MCRDILSTLLTFVSIMRFELSHFIGFTEANPRLHLFENKNSQPREVSLSHKVKYAIQVFIHFLMIFEILSAKRRVQPLSSLTIPERRAPLSLKVTS